jgi:hypothetical protein
VCGVDVADSILEERAPDAGRQSSNVETVLDADRQSVDARERLPATPASARRVGRIACGSGVEHDERADLRLALRHLLETTLEQCSRRVAFARKCRSCVGETQVACGARIVGHRVHRPVWTRRTGMSDNLIRIGAAMPRDHVHRNQAAEAPCHATFSS